MKFCVKKEVFELSKIFRKFKHRLFVVGGFVRDSLIGKYTDDYDLCSFADIGEVEKMIAGTEYSLKDINKETCTATICFENLEFDYSMMRCDCYTGDGSHTPKTVLKAKSIEEDALRRDFTMNALYLDVCKNSLIDPFQALLDIKKRKIMAIRPNTFKEDGVRILRMFRQSVELSFSVENKTLLSAFQNIDSLSAISGVRKCAELNLILGHKTAKNNFYEKRFLFACLSKFNKYKIWNEFYLPASKIKFDLTLRADADCRFLAFVIDAVQTVNPRNIERFLFEFLGEQGLGYSNKEVQAISNVVYGYIAVTHRLSNKEFFFKYYSSFETIQPLIKLYSKSAYKKYVFFFNYIKNNKIAIQVSDLLIKGGDIKKEYPSISPKRYAYILNELLSKVFDGKIKNDKNELLKAVGAYDY